MAQADDPSIGGASTNAVRMNACEQQAIEIANYLGEHSATKAGDIARVLEIPESRAAVYGNYYGWLETYLGMSMTYPT